MNISAAVFLLGIALVIAMAGYRAASPCDPSPSELGRFARIRIAGCSPDLVRPDSPAAAWALGPSQWLSTPWEDESKSLQTGMRFRICYRRGDAPHVYVDLGHCDPPQVTDECRILPRKECVIMTKAFEQSALSVFVPGNPVEAQGTWEVIDPGRPPLAGKRRNRTRQR